MNIENIINQHLHWKSLVESLFNVNDSAILNPSIIIKDDDCDFGKWIYSKEAENVSSNETFQKVKKLHKKFHHLTGKIILCFQSGEVDKARELFTSYGPLSKDLITYIEQLQNELE
jgi:hypothetical protein